MSDDFVTLKLLIVSGLDSERDVLRRAASQVSVPLFVIECSDVAVPEPACDMLAREAPDIVAVDSRMSHGVRQAVVDAARAMPGRPLVLVTGCTEDQALEALAEAGADGVVPAPIELSRAQALLNGCVRARFPNRVLIVDDSTTVRSVVRKVLLASRFRLEAHEAADGVAAVERARGEHFDLVFLDCHMPGQDGFATLSELQGIRSDIKIVMMTAASDEGIALLARSSGAHDLLFKPFYAKDIDAVLNRLFGLVPATAYGGAAIAGPG